MKSIDKNKLNKELVKLGCFPSKTTIIEEIPVLKQNCIHSIFIYENEKYESKILTNFYCEKHIAEKILKFKEIRS